ncbi:MAG TPA: hypothetical protein VHA52_06095 [Candidatus Babeliaceae bacterium]|nr:hypothetical protein [Candidatus Babeliaceae bacterium]
MQNRKTSFIIILLAITAIAACRKKDGSVSKLEVVSYPVIHALDTSYYSPNQIVYYQGIDFESIFGTGMTPSQTQIYYYSFPIGAGPASLNVSAYDSATASSVSVDTVFNGHYNPNQAGLYIYQFGAKSSTGFGSLVEFVIAVTNYTGTPIADTNGFLAIRGTDTTSGTILEIANGLYFNLDGHVLTNGLQATTLGSQTFVPSFFVQTDSTHILFPSQPTNYNYQQSSQPNIGLIGGSNGTVSYNNGVPTVQYTLVSDTLDLNGQTVTIIGL